MKTITTLFLFLLSTATYAFSEAPHYCSSVKLTDCLGVSESLCLKASDKANDTCINKYNLMEKEYEDTKHISKEIDYCVIDNFIKNISISKNKYESCSAHFIEYNKTVIEFIKKEKAINDKRFFEEDDPLHNYSNKAHNKTLQSDP